MGCWLFKGMRPFVPGFGQWQVPAEETFRPVAFSLAAASVRQYGAGADGVTQGMLSTHLWCVCRENPASRRRPLLESVPGVTRQ